MFTRNPTPAARYAFTLLAVTLATLLRFALEPVLDHQVPFIFYFPTVVLCGWFGGLRHGLLSTALSGLIAWYVFIPPNYSFKASDPTAPAQLIIFLLAGTLISLLGESVQRSRRRTEASEANERRYREQLRVTLSSIGDAVIATDANGIVTFLNPVAESLTGWRTEEASGRALSEVFHIVKEETRQEVENPALRAMKEGLIVGLANHTVLIAKDGTELSIDDSGAPIKDTEGITLGAVLIFRDITDRRVAEDRFQVAVESAPNSVVMIDDEGRIILVNKQTERVFGYAKSELIGQQIEMLVPERFRHEHPRLRAGFASDPRARPMGAGRDLYGLRKDGSEIPIEIGLNPIKTKGKTLVLSSIVDITERKRAEEERAVILSREKAAREHAEAASRAKDEFVAMVSHELRVPLNSILGWTELLRTRKLDFSQTAHALEAVERSAKVQVELIEDLLDISRMITGKLVLRVVPVELGRVIEATVDSIRAAADAKRINLIVRLDPKGSWVQGDSGRLRQVIWNLLSNAVKFTPAHGRVEVSVEGIDSQHQITVSDSGTGIRREFLPFVFDRFSQASTSSERKHGGLGLGLAIVKHLVELHGGTVRAESSGEGLGAKFKVMLPASAVREESVDLHQVNSIAENKTVLEGLRIMIVDDEADTRELLTIMLQDRGADVKPCASASEALDAIEQWRPSVLISDIGMKGDDGYSLIRQLRSRGPEQGGDIPAVALTGYARIEDRTRALAAGFQMHVPKPVEAIELVTVVASITGRTGKRSVLLG